ncbi:MAG: serine hydrolase, partial [Bacteroidales bacterium]|nr:serine hydrolase [Bacteroidales bacterium]
MKKIFTILVFSLLFVGIVLSQEENFIMDRNNTEKLVSPGMLDNHMISLMNQYNISGVSAAIVKEGKIVWKSSYGLADRENLLPTNDSTSFLLYSITKTFTGIGLMQLYEDGEFLLDDAINDYLPFEVVHPDYPADVITFRMLMTHTSGIKDNFTVINSLLTYNVDTDLELVAVLEDYLVEGGEYYGENTSFTNSRPGTYFSYSNVGAALGGFLIQCISGQDYRSYIEENIFVPCGMTNSFFRISECDEENIAMEYSYSESDYEASGIKCNPFYPAGFLRSDINDMSKYLKMLLNNGTYEETQIIDSDILNIMMTEYNHDIAPNSGLFFGYDPDNDLWGHNGGFYGVKTGMFMDKDEDWGVVVLSNGAGEPWQILFMLYQYAKDFEIFNITEIIIDDTDHDLILEQDESIGLDITIRNNSDFDFENINAQIICNNDLISFSDDNELISFLNSGETISVPLDYQFNLGSFIEGFEEEFIIELFCDEVLIDSAVFTLYFGNADVLLINDEEHVYRNRN